MSSLTSTVVNGNLTVNSPYCNIKKLITSTNTIIKSTSLDTDPIYAGSTINMVSNDGLYIGLYILSSISSSTSGNIFNPIKVVINGMKGSSGNSRYSITRYLYGPTIFSVAGGIYTNTTYSGEFSFVTFNNIGSSSELSGKTILKKILCSNVYELVFSTTDGRQMFLHKII